MEYNTNIVGEMQDKLSEVFSQIQDFDDKVLDNISEEALKTVFQALIDPVGDDLTQTIISDMRALDCTKIELRQMRENFFGMLDTVGEEMKSENVSATKKALMDWTIDLMVDSMDRAIEQYGVYDAIVQFEKVHPNARLPEYAGPSERGADVFTIQEEIIKPHTYGNAIPTGLAACIPEQWGIDVRMKGGISRNTAARISNTPGTVDDSYVDEIFVLLDNFSDETIVFQKGQKFAQLLLEPKYTMLIKEAAKPVRELKGETIRTSRDGSVAGFGFTGLF